MPPEVDPDQLRPVSPSELAPGMVLPGHLRDKDGSVLVRAGQTLGQEQLSLLEQGSGDLYVGNDWPDQAAQPAETSADAEEVLQVLCLRQGGDKKARLRRHPRRPYVVTLDLLVEEHTANGCEQRKLRVTTCDISVSGFAFIYPQFFHPDTTVHAVFEAVPHKLHLTAVVRNCTYLSGRGYRVGAEFVREPGSSS